MAENLRGVLAPMAQVRQPFRVIPGASLDMPIAAIESSVDIWPSIVCVCAILFQYRMPH